jgi:hypothetical protein
MSAVEVARVTGFEGAGEIVLKCENGPTGAPVSLPLAGGVALIGPWVSSSPAMNLVRRPSIHDPSLLTPGFPALRPPIRLAGLVDGSPVSRSCKSSRLLRKGREMREVPVLPTFEADSTAVQYLINQLCTTESEVDIPFSQIVISKLCRPPSSMKLVG